MENIVTCSLPSSVEYLDTILDIVTIGPGAGTSLLQPLVGHNTGSTVYSHTASRGTSTLRGQISTLLNTTGQNLICPIRYNYTVCPKGKPPDFTSGLSQSDKHISITTCSKEEHTPGKIHIPTHGSTYVAEEGTYVHSSQPQYKT